MTERDERLIDELTKRLTIYLAERQAQASRTDAALRWAISWVESTKGEKVTEAGFKEFLDGVKRIEACG